MAGYKIHYGTTSENYDHTIDCGLPETENGKVHYTMANAPDGMTYYVATAYDSEGNESPYSSEISANFAPSPPSGFKAITVYVIVNVPQ